MFGLVGTNHLDIYRHGADIHRHFLPLATRQIQRITRICDDTQARCEVVGSYPVCQSITLALRIETT